MADWTTNPAIQWSFDGGTTWFDISDHGRSAVSVSIDRMENKQRMADGRLRRYVVAKKRTFQMSWDNFPSVATDFLANGQPGDWMENIHDTVNGAFHMRLRAGSDRATVLAGLDGVTLEVMITDFSKDIVKRGVAFDLWSIDITLEEV